MDYTILLRLVCAHLLSDFLLQPNALVKKKHEKVVWAHLLHSFIHAAAAYLFVAQWQCWYIPVIVFATHFLIDWLKVGHKGLLPFVADQLCHLMVIVVLWLFLTEQFYGFALQLAALFASSEVWAVIIAYLLILKPSSLLIGIFIERWEDNAKSKKKLLTNFSSSDETNPDTGLFNAGRWIGYMERMLILTFILVGQFEAVGFLLAAKSVFRYGDLKEAKDIRMTEYVLIGTLCSFGIAILLGIGVKYLFIS